MHGHRRLISRFLPPIHHSARGDYCHSLGSVRAALAHAIDVSANGVFAALFAPECAVCRALLDHPLRGCVCGNCWSSIAAVGAQRFGGEPGSAIDGGCAIGEYEGALRDVVHALKYQGRRSLAAPLAAYMRARGAAVLNGADLLVPVPLHWRRQLQRGFNQSIEIARHMKMPVADVLARRRHTRPQIELEAEERRANVERAFALRRRPFGRHRDSARLAERQVVLIDDVCTTGATLEACAVVLKAAGVREVRALTAARVALATDREYRCGPPIPTGARGHRTPACPD